MSAHEPEPDESATASERPAWYRLHIWQIQPVRDVLLVVLALALLSFGAMLQSITVPLLIGLGLAYLVEPLVQFLGRKWPKLTRIRVVVGVMILLLLLLGGVIALVLPRAVGQTVTFVKRLPVYVDTASTWLTSEDAPVLLRDVGQQLQEIRGLSSDEDAMTAVDDQAVDEVDEEAVRQLVREILAEEGAAPTGETGGEAFSAVSRVVGTVGVFIARMVVGIIDVIFTLFLICFFFVIFSLSYPGVQEFVSSLLPAGKKERIQGLWYKMDLAISGFVRGRLTIAFILACIFAIGWGFCGVPHALVLGIVIGFFTLVPYLSGIGLPIAWGLLAIDTMAALKAGETGFYISGGGGEEGAEAGLNWFRILLFPAIVYGITQLLDDYVLSPIIQGKATNLSAATIVVAVLAGGSVAGLYGMLLAIPAAACIRILLVDVVLPDVREWLAGRRKDPLPIE